MNVYFYTLGCKVNQYETQEMRELLEKANYTTVNDIHSADIHCFRLVRNRLFFHTYCSPPSV